MNYSTIGPTEKNITYTGATTGILDDSEDATPQDPRLVAADNLWKVCSPILILLGTFGNIVTIVVLCRKSMWKISSSPYLVVLGVADIVVLYTGLLRQWLRYVADIDIRELSPVVCKLHIFSVYTTVDFSVWILVAVSVERFIFVCFPFKAKRVCTRRRAMISLALILLALVILNSHHFYGFGSVYNEPSFNDTESPVLISYCEYLFDDYGTFYQEIWPWIDLSVFSMVPFCIIVVCNISLITKIVRSRFSNKVAPTDGEGQKRVKSSSMTVLLISLNTLFLVTTAPISIYLIGYPEWARTASYDEDIQLTLWWAIVNQLMYLNNSVNFLFYCISGPTFRRELKFMCGRRGAVGAAATVSVAPTGVSVIPLRGQTTTRCDASAIRND
ncbi:probable G-protein coupled receptor 139 [Liolophura sinensis]|uniref:probable G-protein coupled receptor 139 n=1 Tax=Liolophura sinensis TaxID=3198878 RepID=UPI0031590396